MRKITKNGIEILSPEENERINDLVYKKASKDFHYLAFDRQLGGFSPLGAYLLNFPAIGEDKEKECIAKLLEQQEVAALSEFNISLYPVTKIDGPQYYLDLDNCEKHFADILKINDTVYKTKNLIVDFGHGANNFDEDLLIKKLSELLSKSNMLEVIYLVDHEW